jgi:diguanylate cyclase (GGDEF)-like protein/PAS domain S-box-containing protein
MDSNKLERSTSRVMAFPKVSHDFRAKKTVQNGEQILDTVLNNMSQGVTMFDAEGHLVFFNRHYVEMYGLSKEVGGPGRTLQELLDHSVRAGTFPDDPEGYTVGLMESLAEGRTFHKTLNLADGRIYTVENKPIADGGWLATHEDVTERQRIDDRIAHMARHDALTDLPNRVLMRDRLEQELKRVKRGGCLAVMCLDLDHFKSVNDTLGHPIGDELLKLVADRLRSCTRGPDTIARLGGDEFAIIMTQMDQPADAAALARRIRDSITKPYQIDGHQIVTDISIGICISPVDGTEPDILLKNADMALYGAKADGRGAYRFFEPEMDTRMKARRNLEMDLRKALVNGEFELYYQPLLNLQTNEISTFEALLRWHHPTRGMISPAEFIPIAEETGLIILIGEWVLKTACAEALSWPEHVKIAVNLSPAQLKSRNFVKAVIATLAETGMPGHRLQLEITETVIMQNTFSTLSTLHELRKLGVQIAMDDFGTGYSSLSYLRSFPFDKIKIDRSFIEDLSNGKEPLAIVHAVAGLASGLNMISTAEGVETQQQMDTLQSIGCTEMQGYLFSRAMPAKDVGQFFAKHHPTKAAS